MQHATLVRAGLLAAAITLAEACREQTPTAPFVGEEPPVPALTTTPAATEILVGAGNIARCDKQNDEATAQLLDNISGTVFTAGDNVRASGSSSDFADCYGPS
jgi:hypothetical protein